MLWKKQLKLGGENEMTLLATATVALARIASETQRVVSGFFVDLFVSLTSRVFFRLLLGFVA